MTSPSSDDELLGRLRTGGGEALAELFAQQRAALRRMVCWRLDTRLNGRLDPSDVLQEVYLDAAKRLPDYLDQPALPPGLWLRQLAGRRLIELHRQHLGARKRSAGQEVSIDSPAWAWASAGSLASQLIGHLTSPSQAAARAETAARLSRALDEMDELDREVLVLRHFDELSNNEVAALLGLHKAAASNRYVRALKRLKEVLAAMPELNGPEKLDMNDTDADRNPVEELAEEFVARFRAGEDPSVTEYTERYPEYAEEIADLFPAVSLLEDVKGPPLGKLGGLVSSEAAPKQMGDFLIVREIGRGGMGVVYEAEQVSLGRRVALKVLPAGAHLSPGQVERFQREARAAGRLHHTNIVPVFGVGEHEGQHYYVMQMINGQSLAEVIVQLRGQREKKKEKGASTVGLSPCLEGDSLFRFVAQLGVQAADALAYAHAQGIVHRDIKPGNLLLAVGQACLPEAGHFRQPEAQARDTKPLAGASGYVAYTLWITDFGLAKLLEQNDLTRPGETAGTLRYSAPERFAGQSDARSDLFALGLTLYELLTLRAAYDETDPNRLLAHVMKGHISRPHLHNPAIPRDLETIVLKSLAPEPARRYANADELADDLRRFLDDRPITARRASAVEHAWRWCRRNPAVAWLSAALVVVFLLGFSGMAWKWREASAHLVLATEASNEANDALGREEQQRRRADEQRRLAEGNLDLAVQAFERIAGRLALPGMAAPPDAGDDEGPVQPVVSPEAAAILQDLVRFYERFASTNSNDPRLKRDTARALRQVGAIRLRLGQYTLAEEALRRAAKVLGEQAEPLERARLHNELAVVLRAARRPGDASREHQRALAVLAKIESPASEARHEQARTHHLLGALQWRQQRPLLAEQNQLKALEMLAKLVEEDPKNPDYRHTRARAYQEMMMQQWQRDRRPEAVESRTKALEILEALADGYPLVPDYRAELAELLLSLPPRLLGQRPGREAQRQAARALELSLELSRKYPAVPDYQLLLARSRQRLGIAQLAAGKNDEATANLRQAVALHGELEEHYPATPPYRLPAVEARLALAEALRKQKDLAGSEKLLRASLAEVTRLVKNFPRNPFLQTLLARHHRSLGQTLLRQGKKSEAEEEFRKAGEMNKAGS